MVKSEKTVKKSTAQKATCLDKVTNKMLKNWVNWVNNWLWRLYNRAFENGTVSEDWKNKVIVLLYKEKGQKSYIGISFPKCREGV